MAKKCGWTLFARACSILECARSWRVREEGLMCFVLQISLSFQLLLSTLNTLNIVGSCWSWGTKRRTWLTQEAHHFAGEQTRKQTTWIYSVQSHGGHVIMCERVVEEGTEVNWGKQGRFHRRIVAWKWED